MQRYGFRPRARALAIAAVVCSLAGAAGATTIALSSAQDLTDRSDAVVRATVVNGSGVSMWDAEHRFIVTRTRLRVIESLDGALPVGAEITVESPGGFIASEDIGLVIPGAPDYDDDQEVVAFLVLGADDVLRTLDLGAGKFEVSRENGEETLTRKDLGGDGVILLEEPSATPIDAPARRGIVAPKTTLDELKAKVSEASAGKAERRVHADLAANGLKSTAGPTPAQAAAANSLKRQAAARDAVEKGLPHTGAPEVAP